jgi:hypothetical protein
VTAAVQAAPTPSDEAAMKTSIHAFRDDRPTSGAPGAVHGAAVPLAPLLAGARARGVADGLELIGAAAALLDEQGEVLHLNALARSLLGDHLVLSGRRLRARDYDLDQTLAAAIDSTVRHQVASRVALGDEASADGLGVRIMPVSVEADESFQLLRAIAILEPRGAAVRAGLN